MSLLPELMSFWWHSEEKSLVLKFIKQGSLSSGKKLWNNRIMFIDGHQGDVWMQGVSYSDIGILNLTGIVAAPKLSCVSG